MLYRALYKVAFTALVTRTIANYKYIFVPKISLIIKRAALSHLYT